MLEGGASRGMSRQLRTRLGDADWPWQGQIEMLSFANMGAATIFWTVALTASLIATVAGVYFARTDWRDIS